MLRDYTDSLIFFGVKLTAKEKPPEGGLVEIAGERLEDLCLEHENDAALDHNEVTFIEDQSLWWIDGIV